jgi:hypothetical protein
MKLDKNSELFRVNSARITLDNEVVLGVTPEGNYIVFCAEPEHENTSAMLRGCGWTQRQVKKFTTDINAGKTVKFSAMVSLQTPDGNQIKTEYLGSCYYNSYQDFIMTDGCYFDQMVEVVTS